jgi:hypothetical protein
MPITKDTNVTVPVPQNSNKAITDPYFCSSCKQDWIITELKETCGFVEATGFGTPSYSSSKGLEQP